MVHVQHEAVVVVDLRLRLRIELQHPFDGRQRFRVPPRVGEHDGEVELGVGAVRVELDCPLDRLDRPVDLAVQHLQDAEDGIGSRQTAD